MLKPFPIPQRLLGSKWGSILSTYSCTHCFRTCESPVLSKTRPDSTDLGAVKDLGLPSKWKMRRPLMKMSTRDGTGVHLFLRGWSRVDRRSFLGLGASAVEGVCCLLLRHLPDITVGGLHTPHVAAGIGVVGWWSRSVGNVYWV